MGRRLFIAFALLVVFAIVSIGGLVLFSDGVAVLSPKGIVGQKQANLLLIATLLMLIVVVPVFLMTFFIAWKYRAGNHKARHEPNWAESKLAEGVWWGVPLLIIIVLGAVTWIGCIELDPFRPLASKEKPLKIQAVALQWKWLFIYPEQNIATINFLQIPEKRPIDFEITADAPMNSFWIPELGGQVYAMPGMTSQLHLMADGAGSYRGCSSNLSGTGFSGMHFSVVSSSLEEFDHWVSSVRGYSGALNFDKYAQIVAPSEYNDVKTYGGVPSGLFRFILSKYMMPAKEKSGD